MTPRSLIVIAAVGWLSAANGDAAPRVIDLDPAVELRDLGLDPVTGVVRAISVIPAPGIPLGSPTLVTVDRLAITTDQLVGLGPDTQVGGISSDGSRIAGVSKSPGSVDIGEGTTWLSTHPNDPVGIGFSFTGFSNTSAAGGAWSDGVVGDHSGAQNAIRWTPTTGLEIYEDGGGLSSAFDVTADGTGAVGVANSIVRGGGPAYWDMIGFHAFPTPNGDEGRALAVAPNGSYSGGGIGFLEFDPFDAGTQATVWSRADTDYELTLLTNADGSRFKGEVEDVSNSGYAVGPASTLDQNNEFIETGFLWRPGWEAPLDLYAWLNAAAGGSFAEPAPPIVAIAEGADELWFALESPARLIRIDLPSIPGDYNADGAVDQLDYDLWATTYGQTVPVSTAADGNANGRIDAADYTVWRDNLPGAPQSVPEPTALVGALLACFTAPPRSRRTGDRRSSGSPRLR